MTNMKIFHLYVKSEAHSEEHIEVVLTQGWATRGIHRTHSLRYNGRVSFTYELLVFLFECAAQSGGLA